MKSAVMIVPAAEREAANLFGESMGWGLGNFSVALSPTGASPVTHWGCRATVYQGFLDLLANPPESAAPILAAVHIDIRDPLDPFAHFHDVLTQLGLRLAEG